MNSVELLTTCSQAFQNYGVERALPERVSLEKAKKLAFEITGKFEGGKASSLQLKDSGIISYGKHQATLASGTLYKLLDYYSGISDAPAAINLSMFLSRVKIGDKSLREEVKFIDALLQAAGDPLMNFAQDKVFSDIYWLPVVRIAKENGIRSEIGLAILYDTNVQGGLSKVLKRTWDKFSSNPSEREFLQKFLESRKEYLYEIASLKRRSGDNVSAKYLENSARNRIFQLEKLLGKY